MAGVRRLINDLILTPPVPQPMWVEPAILPKGGLLLFGGESKIGKSFLVLEMMRALATGEDMFGNPQFVIPERAKVVLIEQELGDYILRGRAVEVFKEAEEEGKLPELNEYLYFHSKHPVASLSTREGREFIRECVEESGANILFLDPIGKLHAYAENEAGPINVLFQHLADMRAEFKEQGLSVVMTHHFGKLSPDPRSARDELDPLNFRGSSRWVSGPDSLITVKRLRTHERRVGDRSWRWWDIKMKCVLRAGPEPQNMFCTVNKEGDLRVRFTRWEEEDEEAPRRSEVPRLGGRRG